MANYRGRKDRHRGDCRLTDECFRCLLEGDLPADVDAERRVIGLLMLHWDIFGWPNGLFASMFVDQCCRWIASRLEKWDASWGEPAVALFTTASRAKSHLMLTEVFRLCVEAADQVRPGLRQQTVKRDVTRIREAQRLRSKVGSHLQNARTLLEQWRQPCR